MRKVTGIIMSLCLGMGCASLTDYQIGTPALAELADALQQEAAEQNHIIRWNPVNCDCPGWELQLRDRWVRTAVSLEDEELTQGLESAQEHPKVEVEGNLSSSPYRCGPSLLCGSLKITRIISGGVKPLP
jgi:hypothetical protein